MTTNRIPLAAALVILIALPLNLARGEENWPQWRGPNGNGTSPAAGLPTTWGPEENIIWKTALPSWSGGTPVTWGDRIFVTSPSTPTETELKQHEEEVKERQEQAERRGRRGARFARRMGRNPGGQQLLLLSVSKTNGTIQWTHELDQGNRLWMKGNNTSPSPVTDGEHVWVVTGTGAVTALDMDGQVVWQRSLQEDYGEFGHNWGYASSPLLFQGKLILEVLQGFRNDNPSYIVAFDARSGQELWRQDRPTDAPAESPDAYTTPTVIEREGQRQIVITGGDYITGHDPDTGRELWRVPGLNPRGARNYRIVASPVACQDMLFAPTRVRPLLALDVGGTGPITEESIMWKWDERGAPDVPTPVCDGKHLFMVNDSGMVTCVDVKSGEAIWGPTRTEQGTVSGSPLLADGKIYFTNEEGITVVLEAGPEFKMIATNELDGSYTLSSPIALGSQLFIRTSAFLYCIGEKKVSEPAAPGG